MDIGSGQLGGGKAAQHRRQHQRTYRRQPLFGPDAPHGQPAQGGENGTRPRKKAAKRQGEAPGQGIQRGQRPGVPLGQHAEAGQHAPDGQQMPRQLLHKTEEVKVPRHRQRDRQCQPARGPKGRLPGSGAAADAGGSLDGQQKDHGKGGHGPAAVTANLPKQDAAQVKVGQRITAHHRPGPKALIFGYT